MLYPLVMVVAVARNGAIGRDGTLPWRMPGDLARFKARTMGRPMLMGRRTWESIGRALPGRESIVVSRGALDGLPEGVHHAVDPQAGLALARARAEAMGAPEVALIGGAALIAALLPQMQRVHLTIVDLYPEADTVLPALDAYEWREVGRSRPPRAPGDEADCAVLEYEREFFFSRLREKRLSFLSRSSPMA